MNEKNTIVSMRYPEYEKMIEKIVCLEFENRALKAKDKHSEVSLEMIKKLTDENIKLKEKLQKHIVASDMMIDLFSKLTLKTTDILGEINNELERKA